MMIVRKMNKLVKNNSVDFQQEGKNKVYFLKNNIEAQEYVYMAEHYNLLKTLTNYPGLRKIIENIRNNKKITMTLLFGSYAKGLAKKDSDIDVFIETTNRDIKKEINLIDTKMNVKIGKYDRDSLLIKEIEKNHVVLKGVNKYYERKKFFN